MIEITRVAGRTEIKVDGTELVDIMPITSVTVELSPIDEPIVSIRLSTADLRIASDDGIVIVTTEEEK
jgi:hypothetical protein